MKDLQEVNNLLNEIHELEKKQGKTSSIFGYLHRADDLYLAGSAQEQAEILQRRQDDAMTRQKNTKVSTDNQNKRKVGSQEEGSPEQKRMMTKKNKK